MLYVEGPLGAGKTTRLVEETAQLLQKDPSSSILVLCSNHARQVAFTERLLYKLNAPLAQLPVYTYMGYVRNALFNFWPVVEAEIAATLKKGQSRIRPELSGLADSELVLKWLLARLRKQNPDAYEGFPGSDAHIIKQIVRRLRLRSENNLSRQDMQQRSALLNEICQVETGLLETQFDAASYTLRTLDTNKQIDVFLRLMQKDSPLSAWLRQHIRHLVVDDVDETTVAEQRLIEFLAPSVETLIMAADIDGGSRRGYLNAYPYDWQALKALRPGETVALTRDDPSYHAGQTLLANWKRQDDFRPLPMLSLHDRFITRVEMLEQVVEDVLGLLEAGHAPGDLCLVLPKTDFLSFYQLQNRLNKRGIPVQLLSGTRRPSDNPKCRAFVYLLQWANSARWQYRLSAWEMKTMLVQALQFNRLPAEVLDRLVANLGQALQESPAWPDPEALGVPLDGELLARYRLLGDWLAEAAGQPFEAQLYSAFHRVLSPFASERDGFGDLSRIIESYLRQRQIFDAFIHSGWGDLLRDVDPDQALDKLLGAVDDTDAFNRWWLAQVKSGVVADTPEMPDAVDPEAVIIGTPQKIIDFEIARPIQCWLDVGSREWARSDNAPLYNAWVHSAVWDGSESAFSEEFNEAVIRARAGHITRTLMLLATERVHAYASELDDLGFTQLGLLRPRLVPEDEPALAANLERAVLREDQKPILAYQQGSMAISAVPGAGKTFVNVELLLELIQRGIEPDRILVLTYMDSAAKTLLGRLKKKLAGVTRKLPVVSTIHSLAFRILTENDHATLLGYLPDDMTILDDYGRAEILAKVAGITLPESAKNPGDWQRAIDRGINHAKTFGISPEDIEKGAHFRLQEFLPAYRLYCRELDSQGQLDFTDLIVKAVRLLQDYPDIRARYQQQFEVIIEDEAQDSSRLLQELIRLLGGDRPNLIRTGDTNQSITTTFSSADTSVFRDFIRQADLTVHMTQSGRCAPEIIRLANDWMLQASEIPGLERAFEPVAMQPVLGQNPPLLYPPQAELFDMNAQEEDWLVARIRDIKAAHPDTSVAVLVRSNAQVNHMTAVLHRAKIPAVSLSEQMNVNPVFAVILAYLKLLREPGNLEVQAQWYQRLVDAQYIPDSPERKAFLETTPLFYQSPASLPDELLKQWAYDWLELSHQAAGGNIGALIARITDRFFVSVSDRSNGYLCVLMAQEILAQYQHLVHLSPLEIVIHQFEAFQQSWRGRKSFTDVLLQQPHDVIQVMSMHKSKGQEFDVVFMPGLQADSFPHDIKQIRFDESDKLLQALDQVAAGHALPENYQEQKKREKIEEEARLVYVGLTRARRALFLSAHRQAYRYGRLRPVEPALAFHILGELLAGQTAGEALNA